MDRIFGREDVDTVSYGEPRDRSTVSSGRSDDDIALERYRYLLRTAPPEAIEKVHIEAFARLTPQQRDRLFAELSVNAPAGERPVGNDASALAHSATRSELRQPGTMERSLSSTNGGPGLAGTIGGSMLGAIAGYVIGSAIVSSFLPLDGGADASGSDDASASEDASADEGGSGDDFGADGGGGFGDFGGFDF